MRRLSLAATFAFLCTFSPLTAAAQPTVRPQDYPSVDFGRLQPGDAVPDQPGKVFRHNGLGWVIADATPAPSATPTPSLPAAPSGQALRVGRVYVFSATGARVFVAGIGQLPGGSPVLFAVCMRAAEGCPGPGSAWMLPANTDAAAFAESDEVW